MSAVRPSLSRRALLSGRTSVRPALPRPPGALDELAFLDACTRCNACIDACPDALLRRGDGGFPVLDALRGECSFCTDCTRACRERTLQLARVVSWPWRVQPGEGCLASSGIVCRSCRDACGESAIRFAVVVGVAAPVIDAERCTGCGGCVAACPACALSLQQGVIEETAA